MVVARTVQEKYTGFGNDTQKICSEIDESGFSNYFRRLVAV